LRRLKRPRGDEQEPPDAPDQTPDRRSNIDPSAGEKAGYESAERARMQLLIENKATR
jgi:hypothetical protein